MAVTVVETKQVAAASASASLSLTFATTPQPGDVLVLAATNETGTTGRNLTSVTGMGATWSLNNSTLGSAHNAGFAVGTAPNAAGTVTATLDGTSNWVLTGYLVRGLTSGIYATAYGTSSPPPAQPAGAGQVVIGTIRANDSTTGNAFPDATSTPPTGWVATPVLKAFISWHRAAYLLPTGSINAQARVTGSYVATGQIVVGSAAAPHTTLTVAATLPRLRGTATLNPHGTVTATATLPKMRGTLALNPHGKVTAAATLPALRGAFALNVRGARLSLSTAAVLPAITGSLALTPAAAPKSILLLYGAANGDAYPRTLAALEAGGHAVTGYNVSLGATMADLDAVWAAGPYDIIATLALPGALTADWLLGKWGAGIPLLLGNEYAWDNPYVHGWQDPTLDAAMGITWTPSVQGQHPASPTLSAIVAHPVTAGYPAGSDVTVLTGVNAAEYDASPTLTHGTVLGALAGLGNYMTAVEVADELRNASAYVPPTWWMDNAPTRAVWIGWMAAGQTDYTADGLAIIANAVDWLSITPTLDVEMAATLPRLRGPRNVATNAVLPALRGSAWLAIRLYLSADAVLPSMAGTVELATAVGTRPDRGTGRNRNGVGALTYDPPVAPVPPAIAVATPAAYDVAQAYAPPTYDPATGRPTITPVRAKAVRHRDRIVVAGRDITYWRGVPTPVPDYAQVEPLLWGSATLTLPQVHVPFEQPGRGQLRWLKPGARVTVQRVDPATGKVVATDYRGLITAFEVQSGALSCTVGGHATGRLSLTEWPLPLWTHRWDLGAQVASALHNHHLQIDPFYGPETGIQLSSGGGMGSLDYVSELIAKGVTTSGRQWTVMPAKDSTTFKMYLKDTTTADATVYFDDAQLAPDLNRDISEEPNRVYASGVAEDGRRIKFAAYPGLLQGPAAQYPYRDGRSFGQGTTDADTDYPTEGLVTAMMWRLTQMGYLNRALGGYDADAADAIKDLQDDAGLAQTGTMTTKTWDALYDLTDTGYSLGGMRLLPAAQTSATKVWQLSSTGAMMARNPGYDPAVLPVDASIEVGTGFTRQQVKRWARQTITTGNNWVGSVSTQMALIAGEHTPCDPVTEADVMPARALRPGMNLWAPLWDGGTLFHVSGVNVSNAGSTVSLTLDTRARDTMKAWEVISRNRESRRSPARAWVRQHRASRLSHDSMTAWDSIGGTIDQQVRLHRQAWTVFPVVAGQEGTIARIRLATLNHKCLFACAVFGYEVSEKWLNHIAPDPLSVKGSRHWEKQSVRNRLDNKILLYIAGTHDQPCGTWPMPSQDGQGKTGAKVTGVWSDDAGFAYRTFAQPVLWVAVWAKAAAHLEPGRVMWNQLEDGA